MIVARAVSIACLENWSDCTENTNVKEGKEWSTAEMGLFSGWVGGLLASPSVLLLLEEKLEVNARSYGGAEIALLPCDCLGKRACEGLFTSHRCSWRSS